MGMPPQKFREIVFQLLFSSGFGDSKEILNMIMELLQVARAPVKEAASKVARIQENLHLIDEKIKQTSTEYRLERISGVEKTALRLGIYEIFFEKAISPKISMAEAIRLSTKFGTPEGAEFVNAILDILLKHEYKDPNTAAIC